MVGCASLTHHPDCSRLHQPMNLAAGEQKRTNGKWFGVMGIKTMRRRSDWLHVFEFALGCNTRRERVPGTANSRFNARFFQQPTIHAPSEAKGHEGAAARFTRRMRNRIKQTYSPEAVRLLRRKHGRSHVEVEFSVTWVIRMI